MSAERWARLVADLDAAGVAAAVDAKPYAQERYGRIEHGVSRSIILGLRDGGLVTVQDVYGRGGKWYGWRVWRDGRDGLVAGRMTTDTRRSVTVAAVAAAIEIGGGTRSLRNAANPSQ